MLVSRSLNRNRRNCIILHDQNRNQNLYQESEKENKVNSAKLKTTSIQFQ